jgi:hypothetical protein
MERAMRAAWQTRGPAHRAIARRSKSARQLTYLNAPIATVDKLPDRIGLAAYADNFPGKRLDTLIARQGHTPVKRILTSTDVFLGGTALSLWLLPRNMESCMAARPGHPTVPPDRPAHVAVTETHAGGENFAWITYM